MPLNVISGTRSIHDYDKIRLETEKPLHERFVMVSTNRGKSVIPRRFHIIQSKLSNMLESMKDGHIPNPYRQGGVFHAIIQSLIVLGVNHKHSFISVRNQIKTIMLGWVNKKTSINAWDKFINKKPKNSYCAKDTNGKIIQNTVMLQRITGMYPYGEKLRQLGMQVDIYKENNDLPAFLLRTGISDYNQVSPVNEFKKRRKLPVVIEQNIGVIINGSSCAISRSNQ